MEAQFDPPPSYKHATESSKWTTPTLPPSYTTAVNFQYNGNPPALNAPVTETRTSNCPPAVPSDSFPHTYIPVSNSPEEEIFTISAIVASTQERRYQLNQGKPTSWCKTAEHRRRSRRIGCGCLAFLSFVILCTLNVIAITAADVSPTVLYACPIEAVFIFFVLRWRIHKKEKAERFEDKFCYIA